MEVAHKRYILFLFVNFLVLLPLLYFTSTPASAGAQACSRPQLASRMAAAYWASYSDYSEQQLTVDISIEAPEQTARNVIVLGATSNNGVLFSGGVPIVIGDINPGAAASATLRYQVPAGVNSFHTAVYVSALDECGNAWFYPGPYQTTAKYTLSTTDSGHGQVNVNVNWDPQYDSDRDAVATVSYRLYPGFPADGGQPAWQVAGTIAHAAGSSLTVSGLSPGRYYDFAVDVTDAEGVDGAQPQIQAATLLRDDTFRFTNILNNPHPGAFDEVRVRDFYNGALYWYSAQNYWEAGYSYEYLFRNGVNYEYSAIQGKTAWQRVIEPVTHLVFLAGEMPRQDGSHHYRAMIGRINENIPALTTWQISNTDDCNEFIGVTIDSAGGRLLAGERRWGTPLCDSPWSNGGGLWSIGLFGDGRITGYSRIYQDPFNRTWDKMTIFQGRLYAILHDGGTGELVSAAMTDVPVSGQMPAGAWRHEASNIFSLANSPYHGLVAAQGRGPNNYLTLLVNDGSGFRSIDTFAFAGEGLFELPDHRFLSVSGFDNSNHHASVANVNGEWGYLGTFPGAWPSYNYAVDPATNDYYYGTVSPGKVWKVSYTPAPAPTPRRASGG